ncbi:hypothetical protein DFA_05851 [Cavenderia fasciculata]|uniref:Uncharacterized protein n=1 Tax=Cavenderia fasciculata TaxID=261658 RepID=F4PN27_CACFS|nr:uncharacterized protein DFA_05851 [Cavenderia fasciculata]EGG23717.1 hypothetical protein DFA_05851 [Cavenderia fasciculata]|eukprot:XP_004361568.1 hypothetical protein DFA_05851 [Cavenderia fasciculata]
MTVRQLRTRKSSNLLPVYNLSLKSFESKNTIVLVQKPKNLESSAEKRALAQFAKGDSMDIDQR